MKVKIVNNSNFKNPSYKTKGSSGLDLQANTVEDIVLKPMNRVLIPTGIHIELPYGYEAQIRARSGLALNYGISLVNGIGTIDSDYRGEIKVILINLGDKDFIIKNGDRIAQMVIMRYEKVNIEEVEVLEKSIRDKGGFGHTGI